MITVRGALHHHAEPLILLLTFLDGHRNPCFAVGEYTQADDSDVPETGSAERMLALELLIPGWHMFSMIPAVVA